MNQPSAIQLAELVAEVDRGGSDAFLVVERATDVAESRLLTRRVQDGWTVELQDGRPNGHYVSQTGDAAMVFSAVAYWVLRTRIWPGLAWHRNGLPDAGLARAV